jgi:two-component system NtrC family sensor kinase
MTGTMSTDAALKRTIDELLCELAVRTAELSEARAEQMATADVLKVISRSGFNLQTALDMLIESAVKLGASQRGGLYFRDDDVLRLQSHFGFTDEHVAHLREHPIQISMETAAGRPALLGRTVHVADILADPDFKNFPALALIKFRAFLGVPLMRDGEVFGVIAMNRPEPVPFTQRQIELVQTFADQAVIAIENARLFGEVQAKTRDLTEALTYQTGSSNILKVIASSPTDVKPVLEAIVESACELREADDAVAQLREGDELCYAAHRGSIPVGLQRRAIDRNFIGGRAVADKATMHVRDVLSAEGDEFPESQAISRRVGTRTLLCVPLLREGDCIGTILLRRTEVNPFSDKQIALLQTFADQAVIALGNVRLFEEVQARTRDLQESLQQQTATADVLKVISRSALIFRPCSTRWSSRRRACVKPTWPPSRERTAMSISGPGPTVSRPRSPIMRRPSPSCLTSAPLPAAPCLAERSFMSPMCWRIPTMISRASILAVIREASSACPCCAKEPRSAPSCWPGTRSDRSPTSRSRWSRRLPTRR